MTRQCPTSGCRVTRSLNPNGYGVPTKRSKEPAAVLAPGSQWGEGLNDGRFESIVPGLPTEASDGRARPVCVLRGCNARSSCPPEEGGAKAVASAPGRAAAAARNRVASARWRKPAGASEPTGRKRPIRRKWHWPSRQQGNRLMPASKHRRKKGAKAVAHPGARGGWRGPRQGSSRGSIKGRCPS